MRILMVGTLTDEQNGSARLFARMAQQLAHHHDVIPCVPDREGMAARLLGNLAATRVLSLNPLRLSLRSVYVIPAQLRRLAHLLRHLQPDLIYILDIPWCYVAPLGPWLGIPVLVHSQFYVPRRLQRLVVRPLLRQSSAIVHVSRRNQQLWDFPRQQLATYAVPNPGIFEFHDDPQLLAQVPVDYLLVVTRISPEKGVLQALELFAGLAAHWPHMCLVIAGDAIYPKQQRYKHKCMRFAAAYGLSDRVIWLGKVARPHILYRQARAFVHLPQCEDSFPTTIMEALALGTLIITLDKGGIAEQVGPFSGVLLNRHQPSTATVHRFLQNARPQCSQRWPQYRQLFGEERFMQQIEHIIQTVGQG